MTSIKVLIFLLAIILGATLQVSAQKKLQTGKFEYEIELMMGMQSMSMSSIKTIKEKDGQWEIASTLSSEQGTSKDVFTLDKNSLSPTKRTLEEGPVKLEASYSSTEIKGGFEVNRQTHKIEHSPKNALLADGAALFEGLTNLPLKINFEKTYYTYDIQAKRERSYKIKVVAEEEIKVKAGNFKTFKCEVEPSDDAPFTTLFSGKATVWISMEEGKSSLIKYSSQMPNNAGFLTMELSK